TSSSSITNFAPSGSFQTSNGGGTDIILAKFNSAGTSLTYSTFLGGSGNETGNGIAVDSSGSAYICGDTASTNITSFAPSGSFQTTNGGGTDALVAKFNAAGTALTYSTFLGGSGDDTAQQDAVDSSGRLFLTGRTDSTNFPVLNPIQASRQGNTDAFVAEFP